MEKSATKKAGSGFLGTHKKAVHVMAPVRGQGKRFSPSAITEMPPITDPNHEVLEIYPVQDPYSFIRIIYDTQEN
ncbi:MAG: hypothetical protein WCK39_01515, partial [Methanomassiliicoccales archaeon]